MIVLQEKLSVKDLEEMAGRGFGEMVKGVVDVDKNLLALDAELHADLEALLLDQGSKQFALWGINLYPELWGEEDFVEFDSMINLRPSQGNFTRAVDDDGVQSLIRELVIDWIVK